MDTNWNEHYIKRGNPAKPTYYIIRRMYDTTGLFALHNIFAGHIRYALSKGWLLVVDMQNYPNAYLAPEKLGKENSWEYYFEQPLRIGLEQAYNGENIILGTGNEVSPRPYEVMSFYENLDNILTEWRMLIKLGLIRIKPERTREILSVRQNLFLPEDRVLGVLLRGTDYLTRKLYNHPIPPPIEFAISIVVDRMEKWQCNKLFLATEDKSIVSTFKNIFGDLCIMFDRKYVNYNPKIDRSTALSRIDRPNDNFQQGKDYLTQIVLLSMCNSLVAARCGGSVGVMMMTDKFEHTYFFNLGRYGVISLD